MSADNRNDIAVFYGDGVLKPLETDNVIWNSGGVMPQA